MAEMLRRQLREARRRGAIPWTATVLGAVSDLLLRAVYERRRGSSRSSIGGCSSRGLLHDLRFAFRSLVRSPRFTLLAILTLALGIGANVALFSVVHGVVLRPLPFPEVERVVHLAWDRGTVRSHMPAFKFDFWREHSDAFEAMTTWWEITLTVGEGPDSGDAGSPVGGLRVPASFLDVLGFEPALGRDFAPSDDRPGAPSVALVSHDLWLERWGGDRSVVNTTVRIGGEPRTLVGVLPADFAFPHSQGDRDVLVPAGLEADPLDESESWPILALLAPDVTREAAARDLERVTQLFRTTHPELLSATDRGMVLASYEDLWVGGVESTLWILMGATGLVLLIACANVAALLLARGSARQGELAVRTALGAGRWRITRQLLSESLLLAVAGSAVGIVAARFGVEALLGLYPGTLPRTEWIGLNGTVVAYAVAAAVATGVVFGLVVAFPVMRRGVASTLREEGRGGTGRGSLRRLVLASEAAVAVVLLVGAGLLISTLAEIRSVDPGFEPEGLVIAPLTQPPGGWESAGGAERVEQEWMRALRVLPGVEAVASSSTYPLRRGLNIPVGIQGRPDAYEGAVEWHSVSPGYLEAMRIPLLEGRGIRDMDDAGAPPVALVNRAFAERWFPDGDALGRRIEIGRYRDRYIDPELDQGGVEIVGVIADVREISLKVEARRTVIVPAVQVPPPLTSTPVLLIRTADRGAIADVRSTLAGLSGGTAPELREMEEVIGASLASERFNALLMSVFAGVALLLTGFGIYGVVSYTVRQQTREIGIRMALGARRWEVMRMVVGQGFVPVAVGLVAGVGGALLLARFISGLLWGVEPTDPRTLAGVAVALAAVAVASSWLPVREATGIDPNRSLRPD